MTLTTSEGFIVVEMSTHGIPTMRMWILHSDVDANIFARMMYKHSTNIAKHDYIIRRANVTQFETK